MMMQVLNENEAWHFKKTLHIHNGSIMTAVLSQDFSIKMLKHSPRIKRDYIVVARQFMTPAL